MHLGRMRMVVYLVDPDAAERRWIEAALSSTVQDVRAINDAEGLLAVLGARTDACLMLATEPDPVATLEFVRELRRSGSPIPVIAVGSKATMRMVTEFVRCPATDFLARPLSAFHLRAAVRRAGGEGPVTVPPGDQ
jgi:FixJ family two-component response regulator